MGARDTLIPGAADPITSAESQPRSAARSLEYASAPLSEKPRSVRRATTTGISRAAGPQAAPGAPLLRRDSRDAPAGSGCTAWRLSANRHEALASPTACRAVCQAPTSPLQGYTQGGGFLWRERQASTDLAPAHDQAHPPDARARFAAAPFSASAARKADALAPSGAIPHCWDAQGIGCEK